MPKSSHFSIGAQRRMHEIALRMQSRMRQLGYSQDKLSTVAAVIAGEMYSQDDQPTLRRDRLAKILMNTHGQPKSSMAIKISDAELAVLARALKCSVEWLSGRGLDEEPVVWNVLTDHQRSGHLIHLMEEYEETTRETTVWSEYLLCSFTTEEFMTAFHQAHFGEMDTAGVTEDKRSLVEFFNRTGRARRKHMLKRDRRFAFTNLIYDSELQRIAAGEGYYRAIPRSARKATFSHIANVLMEPTLKMDLVIVDEKKTDRIKAAWRDHETVGVMGDVFSMWNYHSGFIGWTENPTYVRHQRDLMNELGNNALYQSAEETAQYIKRLASSI